MAHFHHTSQPAHTLPDRRRLFDELCARTRTPPPPEAVRVWLGGQACGWAAPAAAETIGVRHGQVELPRDEAGLAALALRLHEAGVLNGWRGELLDVLGEDDSVLGRIERAVMRPLGLRTRAVHLNAYAPDGRMWIARRALHKNTDPGLWDTLVGGLIAAGESPALALVRESDEEAGLSPAQVADARVVGAFMVSRRVPEGYQQEQVLVSECVLPQDCVPSNRDQEVDEIRLAPVSEVLALMAEGAFTIEAALAILVSLDAGGWHG